MKNGLIAAFVMFLGGGFTSSAAATILISNPGGWQQTVTFDEFVFPLNTIMQGDEYASLGVTFTPLILHYYTWSQDWGGITGGFLTEGYGDPFETITMNFFAPVSAVGFNLRAADGVRIPTVQVRAWNGAALVEEALRTIDETNAFEATPAYYFGFSGIVFDRISIDMLNPDPAPPCCGANFDNLSFIYSTEVPTPASLALFGIGLAGLGWSRRKKV